MTCSLTTFLRVYRETQEFLQLHFVCLFFQFLLLPKLSLKVRIKAMGKEKPPPSPAPASGTNTNKNTCACVPGAGKLDLKSAAYKESSHPDASLVSSATQKAQLRAVWVQNQPAQEDFWQLSMLCLVTLKAGGTFLMTGGPHLSRSQDHPQNGEGNALMVKTGREAKMALDSVQGPN